MRDCRLHTFAILLLFSGTVIAKGATVQVSVSGPGLDVPRHSSDPDIIYANVWGYQYASLEDGPVTAPPPGQPRYTSHFWVRWADDIRLKYTIQMSWDSDSETLLVYIPGQRDLWYTNNAYTITNTDVEGKWFPASTRWGNAIAALLD